MTMANPQTNTQQDVSDFRRTDAPTTEQARKTAHELVDTAADKAEGAEARLREEASRLGERASERKEQAQAQIDAGLSKADAFIRERPLAAAGIAFAAGAATALLLRRS
jgi:ElaB/YqjD/DUF883 family membrane-anchored ribosome-binding protein